jgi:hypothetical protein
MEEEPTSSVKCPVCKKEMHTPKELMPDIVITEELKKMVDILDTSANCIVEIINHFEELDTMGKKMSVLSSVLEHILFKTVTNDWFRIAILDDLHDSVRKNLDAQKLNKIMRIISENQKVSEKENSEEKVMRYVS